MAAVLGEAGLYARFVAVPESFSDQLLILASTITKAVKEDPFFLPFDTYAAPSLQVLMLVLRARQQEGE